MVLKVQATSKRNKNSSDIECLDEYDIEEDGFMEGDVNTGKVLSTFSFGISAATNDENRPNPAKLNNDENLAVQPQTYTSSPRGLTPPINGENFTIKRSYAMRPSTVRKINELKATHPDVNVLFNTIVDMAISHYYDYIINGNGTFEIQEEKKKTS